MAPSSGPRRLSSSRMRGLPPGYVQERMAQDPAWQQITPDNRWVCPFCLHTVRNSQGNKAALIRQIEGHLSSRCSAFKNSQGHTKPLKQVQNRLEGLRIEHFVRHDQAWQVFDNHGYWYSPLTLQCVPEIQLGPDRRVNNFIIQRIVAATLRTPQYFQGGVHPVETVRQTAIQGQLSRSQSSATLPPGPTMPTTTPPPTATPLGNKALPPTPSGTIATPTPHSGGIPPVATPTPPPMAGMVRTASGQIMPPAPSGTQPAPTATPVPQAYSPPPTAVPAAPIATPVGKTPPAGGQKIPGVPPTAAPAGALPPATAPVATPIRSASQADIPAPVAQPVSRRPSSDAIPPVAPAAAPIAPPAAPVAPTATPTAARGTRAPADPPSAPIRKPASQPAPAFR